MSQYEKRLTIPSAEEALPGRNETMVISGKHFVNGNNMLPPYPAGLEMAMFGLGCFWGAERKFWQVDGVFITAVGYAAGSTPNPNYAEVCGGLTGHNEVVFVVFDGDKISYEHLLKLFWQSHDPTQGMQQGNDRGTQYRSGIYTYSSQQYDQTLASRDAYQSLLTNAGHKAITTEIIAAPEFYFAEEYHQQYLAKNPNGYCGLGGTGILFA